MLIGEFAWGYESLLNRVTEGTREAGPELLGTLERVVALLPGLVDQLRGGPSPGGEVAALMAAAEALGEGRSLPAEAAAVPLVEAPAVEEVATTDAGVVEEAAPEDVMEAVEVAEAEPEPES
jgi:chemosensory pili system protein ChpA (sensor histidine kinase/response regulator)